MKDWWMKLRGYRYMCVGYVYWVDDGGEPCIMSRWRWVHLESLLYRQTINYGKL